MASHPIKQGGPSASPYRFGMAEWLGLALFNLPLLRHSRSRSRGNYVETNPRGSFRPATAYELQRPPNS